MKSATAQPKLVRKTMGLYARAIWQYPWLTSGSFFVSTLYTMGEDILLPLLLAHLVDLLIKGNQLHAAYVTLAWFSVVAMSDFVTARLSFTFRNPTLTRTTKDLSMQLFDAYERQEYDFYTNSFVGSLVARANRFTNTFKDLYDAVLFPGTALVLQVAAPIVILSLRSLWLGIAFLVATIAMTAITVVLGRYKTPHLRRSSAAESEVTGALADVLSNNLAVRVFAHTPYERARFDGVVDKRRRLFDKQTQVSERIRAARSMTVVLFQISVAFLLVKLTQSHTISIGTILLAQIYLTKLVSSLWNMNRIVERLEESLADAAEMTEVMLRQPTVTDPAEPNPLQLKRGDIDFQAVMFSYQDAKSDQRLFEAMDLHIPAGQKVGLVGPSGGGKSTFTKLLVRFMDVQDGAILLDNQDITRTSQAELRRHIAYVPQEPVLFHRSIRENIAYGDPSAPETAIREAARLAHAAEFIEALPHGYDTLVGERGVKLSGGEKQRIAIARAMLKQSPVLILDEATSALDSKSEKAIVAALDNLMKNRTTIVIAHRLSTIRKLDRILVLKDGHLVEDGSHAQLSRKHDGVYAELWKHQSGEFLEDE